jgi:hypothetical protein
VLSEKDVELWPLICGGVWFVVGPLWEKLHADQVIWTADSGGTNILIEGSH